jgi:hypothetical protein
VHTAAEYYSQNSTQQTKHVAWRVIFNATRLSIRPLTRAVQKILDAHDVIWHLLQAATSLSEVLTFFLFSLTYIIFRFISFLPLLFPSDKQLTISFFSHIFLLFGSLFYNFHIYFCFLCFRFPFRSFLQWHLPNI